MTTDTKATHTPGPWRVHQHSHNGGELWLTIGFFTHEGTADPDGRWIGPIAELKYLIARDEEQWANARLIAAAPELLAALKALFDDYKKLADSGDAGNWKLEGLLVGRQALAAIAKAEWR